MKRVEIQMLGLIAALLLPVGLVRAQGHTWPDDPGQLGHYAIGHTSYLLTDTTNGNRPVYFTVWYPADASSITYSSHSAEYPLDPYTGTTYAPLTLSTDWEPLGYDRAYEGLPPSKDGPFPLLMVSPGLTCDAWMYMFIGTRLASHGYVVAALEHWADGQWQWSPSDDPLHVMVNRPRDVSFAITELLAKNRTQGELLFHSIDPKKIAASGHSLGGYATYTLAGGDHLVCDAALFTGDPPYPANTCVAAPADDRIKAIVSLDGSSQLLHYSELGNISVPSLIVGETVDQSDNSFGPDLRDWIARPHAAIDRPDSYRVDVNGANHYSFTAVCDAYRVWNDIGWITDEDLAAREASWPCANTDWNPTTIPSADAHQVVTKYMIAFLDTYLGGPNGSTSLDSWILTPEYALDHTPTVQFFDSEGCFADLPDHTYFRYRPFQNSTECDVAQKDPIGWFTSPSGHRSSAVTSLDPAARKTLRVPKKRF